MPTAGYFERLPVMYWIKGDISLNNLLVIGLARAYACIVVRLYNLMESFAFAAKYILCVVKY
jgi:hypothetical protein